MSVVVGQVRINGKTRQAEMFNGTEWISANESYFDEKELKRILGVNLTKQEILNALKEIYPEKFL